MSATGDPWTAGYLTAVAMFVRWNGDMVIAAAAVENVSVETLRRAREVGIDSKMDLDALRQVFQRLRTQKQARSRRARRTGAR